MMTSPASNIRPLKKTSLPVLFFFFSVLPPPFGKPQRAMAQQRSHVPKFGNWDTENVPYTTYFEKARNEKGGRMMINPNDPEQNPSAFSHNPPRPPKKKEDDHHMQKISLSEEKSVVSRKSSTTTESGSDFSSSDMSLMQSNKNNHHHRVRSRDKKSSPGSSNMYSFPPPSPSLVKGGTHRPNDDCQTHKVASVPKFGSWDETDPRSGEGFTIIFNKVKQEKQIGATKFPRAGPELSISSNHHKHKSAPEAKVCCCFFMRSKK